MSEFGHQKVFELGKDDAAYRRLTDQYVSTTEFEGRKILRVEPEALTELAAEAIRDVSHLFRPGHLAQLRLILEDPEASDNDRFVARQLLENANVSSGMVLPSCQDTGTGIVMGQKGQQLWTPGDHEQALAPGIPQPVAATGLRDCPMAFSLPAISRGCTI